MAPRPSARPARPLRSCAAALASLLPLAACGGIHDLARVIANAPPRAGDARIFASRPLQPTPTPFRFRDETEAGLALLAEPLAGRTEPLAKTLEENETLAFVVLHGNAVRIERYFRGFGPATPSLAFSVTKSILGLLVGCAVEDGIVRADEPLSELLPELSARGFAGATLEHLLSMTSGSDHRRSSMPWGDDALLYYTDRLEERLLRARATDAPGSRFTYKNGDAELLGLALSRALSPRTLTGYLQERLWTPLGMEHGGGWSLDHPGGLEKSSCCLSTTAIDLAKIGRLMLLHGTWQGRQVVPADWIDRSTRPLPPTGETGCDDFTRCDHPMAQDGPAWFFRNDWWIMSRARGDFMASGILGQFVYVAPAADVVIVRLGAGLGGLSHREWRALLVEVAERAARGDSPAPHFPKR